MMPVPYHTLRDQSPSRPPPRLPNSSLWALPHFIKSSHRWLRPDSYFFFLSDIAHGIAAQYPGFAFSSYPFRSSDDCIPEHGPGVSFFCFSICRVLACSSDTHNTPVMYPSYSFSFRSRSLYFLRGPRTALYLFSWKEGKRRTPRSHRVSVCDCDLATDCWA